jgi:glycosyltransferase involved in cell wall biosynthesis
VIRPEWLPEQGYTMDPKFSILVPTRQRPDTLLATLATLIWQTGDDYEIVVADNFGDDDVAAVITAAQQRHPRIRHIRSDRVLPMAENWERGLAACSGEYVSVLGDDDGFLPSTLDVVRKLIAVTEARVISWEVHTYWWPDTIVTWNKNKLYVSLGHNDVAWIQSRSALVQTYRDSVAFGALPMIYNGFVHRDVINSVIDRFGAYFVPAFVSPDVASGIVNLVHTSRFLHSFRPFAVRGNSRRSTGSSFWARSLGTEQQNIYLREEGRTIEQLIHRSMTASKSIGFGIASTKLHLKDLLFPHDNELKVDLPSVVQFTIATLNNDADAYDDNLAEALQLAERIGFTVDPSTIPAKTHAAHRPLQGPRVSGTNVSMGINCDMANVFDIAGAARLAEAMSPELNVRVVPAAVAEPQDKAS